MGSAVADPLMASTGEPAWAAKFIPPPDPQQWELRFDGLCEPNPGGVMVLAWLLKDRNGELGRGSGHRGPAKENTNNVGEWWALGHGLAEVVKRLAAGQAFEKLIIRGDSTLVIHQLTGQCACNKEHLAALRDRCRTLLSENHINWDAEWVPREKNEEADAIGRERFTTVTGRRPTEYRKGGRR